MLRWGELGGLYLGENGFVGNARVTFWVFGFITTRNWSLYYQSKRYCPLLVMLQGGGLCIFP